MTALNVVVGITGGIAAFKIVNIITDHQAVFGTELPAVKDVLHRFRRRFDILILPAQIQIDTQFKFVQKPFHIAGGITGQNRQFDAFFIKTAKQAIWNKNDNRTCPPNPDKWSLFCALTQATVEVSGGVHYRQPAHEKVREVLNEVGGNRVKTHRLMDYNNHPDTTLQDVHNLLIKAKARITVG